MTDWVRGMLSGQTWNAATMPGNAPHAWISQGFEALGIDPGVTNVATASCTSGARALVFSASKIERKLGAFDQRIDAFKSRNTPARLRELNAKLFAESSLPLNLRIERRTLIKEMEALPALLSLRRRRADLSREIVHKLTSQIVAHAKRVNAGVVVLSRNKGMKNASGKGRAFEKRSHRLPHALIASQLRYKLWEAGRVLIETEESFTSQASFMDSDLMPTHAKGAAQMKTAAAKARRKRGAAHEAPVIANIQEKEETTTAEETARAGFSGARGASGNQRHWFSRHWPYDAPGKQENKPRRSKVHADAQAALNAIRKVSPGFECSPKVSLGHEVWGLAKNKWRILALGPGRPLVRTASFLEGTIEPLRGKKREVAFRRPAF